MNQTILANLSTPRTPKLLFTTGQLLMVLSLSMLGACAIMQPSTISTQDGAGRRPVNLDTIGNAIPKIEPITKAGNKSPYTQFGKTYHVLRTSKGFRETGIASWYGSKFHGRKTSNGEVYNMYTMTAAHKTLPIPTYVKVTNQENRRSIIVRVNDRGPFHESRIIDLSYVAALKLGFAEQGTARVSIEALDPTGGGYRANKPPSKTIKNPASVPSGNYLQAGAFGNHKAAEMLANQILMTLRVSVIVQNTDQTFKVWVGPFSNDEELKAVKERLKKHINIPSFTVKP